MSEPQRPAVDIKSYEEYARKMDLFIDGPTTTHFEQLIAAGIQLPQPELIADADIRAKLWEVVAGLAKHRVFLEHTNHLDDRQLYGKLWHEMLRHETPAVDEIGFNAHLDFAFPDTDEDTAVHLKYYASGQNREWWRKDYPDDVVPPHEDPPFNRDDLLPGPHYTVAEAAAWLRANWSDSAFATNRFHTTQHALKFVAQLYAAGATSVAVDNEMILPNHGWTPYADTLLVRLPDDPVKRSVLFDLMEHVGKPDEDGDDHPLLDSGQAEVRLWWD